jgi:tetratricopeptide (TPR) repeat protein
MAGQNHKKNSIPGFFMILSGHVSVSVLLLLFTFSCFAQDAGVLARLRIEKQGDSPWPASVGLIEVWPTVATSGQYSMTTVDGAPVQARTVWSGSGESTLIRFNTASGATAYYLTFATNAIPASGSWNGEAGVMLETRACKEEPLKTREEFTRAVNRSGPIYGRGYVPNVFLGMNPYGPSQFYVSLFNGWFQAPQSGDYAFATVSSDASQLEIDGRPVAEWLGRHDPHGGRRGEHSGRIQLKAGVHRIQLIQVLLDSEPSSEAAWKPPGRDRFEVMQPSVFLPVARFRVARYENGGAGPDQPYGEWHDAEHCRLADNLVVKVRLRAVDAGQRRTYKWRFDDGSEAAGQSVQHFFAQPGLRQVGLEAWEQGRCVATNTLRLRVTANWLQREDWRQDIFNEAKQDFLGRDLSLMPVRDLGEILETADRADDRQYVNRVGEIIIKRAEEFNSASYGVAFYKLGLSFQHEGDWGDRLAEKALRLALTPPRTVSTFSEKARLRLADLLLQSTGQFDEAEALLNALSGNGLNPDERRLWKLLAGDLLLARGRVEEARKQYTAVGVMPGKDSGRYGLGHKARLEAASVLLAEGNYEEAQRALDLLAFENPLDRLSLETGLVRTDLSLKRKEFQRAFNRSQALLFAPGDSPQKAGLLGAAVESSQALGKTADAQRALRQLLTEFPFSEAAARAKAGSVSEKPRL